MKKMMKFIAPIIALVMVAACASPAAPAAPAAPGAAAPAPAAPAPAAPAPPAVDDGEVVPAHVDVWVGDWWSSEKPMFEEMFAALGDGWSLNLILLPVAGYLDSALITVAAGDGPDVMDLDTLMVPSAIDAGMLWNLDDFTARYGITRNQFVTANWDAGMSHGSIFALPNRSAGMALAYNLSMFQEHGIDPPTDRMNLAEFRELAKVMTDLTPEGVFGFGIAASRTDQANVITSFGNFLWAAGGDFLTPDMSASNMSAPGSIEGIRHWVEMYTIDESVPPGSIGYAITRDLFPMFLAERLAMVPLNESNMRNLLRGQADGSVAPFEFGTVLKPGYARAGGWSFGIPVNNTDNIAAAEFFIDWYLQPDIVSRNEIVMPGVIDGLRRNAWDAPYLEIFYVAKDYVKPAPPHPRWSELQEVVIAELQNALTEGLSIEEAGAAMDAGMNAIINR